MVRASFGTMRTTITSFQPPVNVNWPKSCCCTVPGDLGRVGALRLDQHQGIHAVAVKAGCDLQKALTVRVGLGCLQALLKLPEERGGVLRPVGCLGGIVTISCGWLTQMERMRY
jgi:hypothetical protein